MIEQPDNLGFAARTDQPLIGVMVNENGRNLIRYFTEETAADEALSSEVTQAALNVIGAWSDLDWDAMEVDLDRIRHESTPTPPIEL